MNIKDIAKSKDFLLTCLIGVIISASFASIAYKTANAQALNIELSPAKNNFNIEQGKTYEKKLRLGNYSGSKKTLYIYARDFLVLSNDGTPTFIENQEEEGSNTYSLRTWITFAQDVVELEDNETIEIPYTITVPQNATTGGHYAAIFVQSEKPDANEGSRVGTIGRVASLILTTVPGEIEENASIVDFKTNKKFYFVENPEIEFSTTIKNSGNVHIIPTGAIFIEGNRFFPPINTIFNQSQSTMLPESPDRSFSEKTTITKRGLVPPMGKIQANILLKYGTTERLNTMEADTTFWLIPLKFLLTVLLGVLLSLFILWRAALSFKKENKLS
ncbi:hypothetical protein H6802_01570 [Candidatus Nomurabacteria bacterium]|nr:hypothetical protein [Candidatus Nomurabacteria bacterium]MCB9827418.1 hypothetical protein [Candidatus Nomurabacteria bacterium]